MTDTDTSTESSEEVEAAPTTEVEAPASGEPPIAFWDRPYVERYFVPLVLPLVVVVTIVVYVLNVSRLFLSAHGHIPIIIGTVITLVILGGATLLSAGERLRQSTIILVTAAFLLSLSFAGWISLGHSQEKGGGETALAATLKTKQTLKVTEAPGGAFAFQPNALTATTGLAEIDVNFAASGHTFNFHETTTLFAELNGTTAGPMKGVAFFPSAGTYNFYCSIPGHEAAGMKGTITVTGPTVTLQQAMQAAGNPPGAK